MTDPDTLATTLIANHRTVYLPSTGGPDLESADWWSRAKARRVETLAAQAYRDRLLGGLMEQGYRFLRYLEPDPEGGRRLHIFVFDDAAVACLDRLSECEAGDPATFDPEEFIRERLTRYFG
jgi:hypothetical protein